MRNGGYYFALKKEGSNRELNWNFGVARNYIASCNIAKLILHNALCNKLYNVFFLRNMCTGSYKNWPGAYRKCRIK